MVASGLGTGTGTVGLLLTGPVKAALDRQSLSEAKCFHFSLGWTPGAVITRKAPRVLGLVLNALPRTCC